MKQFSLFLIIILTLSIKSGAQTEVVNVPRQSLAELKKFNPYLGMYNVNGEWQGSKFTGTFEWKPAIKNWYLESTIQVQDESKKMDRELRIMMTWDAKLQKYRLWRFQTSPHSPPDQLEGEAKFINDELVQEWKFKDETGEYTFRNRLKMTSPDQLLIISEEEEGVSKKVTQLGTTSCTRIATKNKYTL
jgi:hypothetical protein